MSYIHREQDMCSVPFRQPVLSSSFTRCPAALTSISTTPLSDRALPLTSLDCPLLLPTPCQWCGHIGHSRRSSKHCLKRKILQEDEHQPRPIPTRTNHPFYLESSSKSSSTYLSLLTSRMSSVPPSQSTFTSQSISLSQATFTPQSTSPSQAMLTPQPISPSQATFTPQSISPSQAPFMPQLISPSQATFTPPSISPSVSVPVSGLQSFAQSPQLSTLPSPLVPEIRVFGTALAAFRTPDDTTYNSLRRMDVPCSECGAMHWIEVHLVFIYAWALF